MFFIIRKNLPKKDFIFYIFIIFLGIVFELLDIARAEEVIGIGLLIGIGYFVLKSLCFGTCKRK